MIESQLLLSVDEERWRCAKEAKEDIALLVDGSLIVQVFPMFLVLPWAESFCSFCIREKE